MVVLKMKVISLSEKRRIQKWNSVQSLSRVQFFATPWTAACQASLSITNSWSLPKLMSSESVITSNHFILCVPLLMPSIFPCIKVFSNESPLRISGQSIGVSASASVLPMNTQEQPHVQGVVAAWAQEGQEELLHFQGHEGRLCPRLGAVAALCWSSREEIPHAQSKKNPSKTVGVVTHWP